MRKLLVLLIGVCFVAGIGMIMSGCGQQTPTINTSNPQPAGLKLKGIVRAITLNGTVGNPVAGATASLSGDIATQTVATNSNGEYVFSNIPDGQYVIFVTAEGYARVRSSAILVKPSSNIPADNTITVTDLYLSSNPVILSFSPTPNSVVANNQTFTVTFDEAMDTSTIVPMLIANGVRTYATSGSTVPLTTSWDSANKVLTITPQAQLITNETYVLGIDTLSSHVADHIRDAAGFPARDDLDQAQALSQNYRVTTGGAPGAPAGVSVVIGSKIISSDATDGSTAYANYADIKGAANVGFYWTPATGVVTGYKIYVANEASGNYILLATATGNVNYYTESMTNIINKLCGSGAAIDPLGTANYPMINKTLYVKVVAYNGDGESAAGSGTAKDMAGPRLSGTAYKSTNWTSDTVLNNNYVLPAITDTHVAYIAFTEPVDPATAGAAGNYTIAGGNVTGAQVMTSSSTSLTTYGGSSYTIVKITADVTVNGNAITVTHGSVKDLAGNTTTYGAAISVTP